MVVCSINLSAGSVGLSSYIILKHFLQLMALAYNPASLVLTGLLFMVGSRPWANIHSSPAWTVKSQRALAYAPVVYYFSDRFFSVNNTTFTVQCTCSSAYK